MRRITLCFLLSSLLLKAAHAGDDVDRRPADDYIFDCTYVNFAWGQIVKGFYIDGKRQILQYDRSDEPLPLEESYFSEPTFEDLQDRYKSAKLVGQVDIEELREKVMLIVGASKGRIVRRVAAADACAKVCTAYLHDMSISRYPVVTLGTIGIADVETQNMSPEAQHLLEWLQEVEPEKIRSHNERLERTP